MAAETPKTRLDKLLGGLHKAAQGKVKLPVIRPGDAEEITTLFHKEIDEGTDARAMMALAHGHPQACQQGCNHCCANAPAIFAGEAVTIARWLNRPENLEVRERFLAKYPGWYESVAELLGAWSAAATEGDAAAAELAHQEVWRRGIMCAFNHEGSCTIYAVRPGVCRNAHAIDTAEHCKPDTDGKAAMLPYQPLENYLVHIRPVVWAMHAALRDDKTGAQPLCVAVRDELASPSGGLPGRNEPCHCGSGKKYKQCHGAEGAGGG